MYALPLQIFGHMHPRDLLNLARTTKDFRTFLMSRDASPFWKAARQQVDGLPECPEHLSEPAFANLVFFSHCHVGADVSALLVVSWRVLTACALHCRNVSSPMSRTRSGSSAFDIARLARRHCTFFPTICINHLIFHTSR